METCDTYYTNISVLKAQFPLISINENQFLKSDNQKMKTGTYCTLNEADTF